jgi:hypothetical protein
MLLGLAALGIPVLIHLINRRRMKPRPLATLEFLDQQDVANAFAPVPRDLLQLLLRLLLLTLFILLMARLTGPSATIGPRAVAIVLDNSMSMKRLTPDGRSLADVHRERILSLVRGMKQGDYFSFTLVGDQVFDSTGFTSDRARLEQAVTNAWVSDGGARSLCATLEDSLRELRSRRAPNMALIVFSDQQARNYRSQVASPSLAPLLQGSRIKTVFVTDPVTNAPNLELQWAEFYPEQNYMGAGGKVAARLYNPSVTQLTAVVSLKSGEVVVDSRSCNVASGETAQVEIRNIFGSQFDSAWKVSLGDDGFAADNDWYSTVRMLKRREVLLVTSPAYPLADGTAVGSSGANLFACAVNPAKALLQEGGTYIGVTPIEVSKLERKALSLYSMVVLYGVQDLPMARETVQDLEMFARNGGGVYLIPDATVNPTVFNDTFAPLLAGFRLGALQDSTNAAALDTTGATLADPLFRGLLRGEWGTINDVRFTRYFSVFDAGATRAALQTAAGDTLIAMAELGKGRVCVQTHSWNLPDTSLPRSLPFVSVVQAIVDRLTLSDAEASSRPDHIRVGDYHRLSLPIDFRGMSNVVMEGPRSCSFPMLPDTAYITAREMYAAGAYRATHPRKVVKDRWLAVNRATEESDATFMDASQLATLWAGSDGLALASDRLDTLFLPRHELFTLLLALVFVAWAAESLASLLPRRNR